MRFFALLLAACCAAPAGEFAVLSSGARLHVDRHQQDGSKLVLFNGSGTIELDAREVRRFEPEDATAPPAPATPAHPAPKVEDLIHATALKYGLPPSLLRSVVKAESGYRQDAVSSKGAIGLMQLLPSTAQLYGADPRNAAQNLDTGARYLADLLRRYQGHLWHALAAYNAGPGALEKYHGGIPPYRETLTYIRRIERDRQK